MEIGNKVLYKKKLGTIISIDSPRCKCRGNKKQYVLELDNGQIVTVNNSSELTLFTNSLDNIRDEVKKFNFI
jgi:hypothetical protein